MDFAAFDTVGANEAGRSVQLTSQATGEPLMDGDLPCTVLVLGAMGRAVQKALHAVEHGFLASEEAMETIADIHGKLVKRAAVLVAGFPSGVQRKDPKTGKLRPARAPQDVEWFLWLNMIDASAKGKSFAEQIVQAATDRDAYLGNGLSGLSLPPNK